jgi:glucose/arabinose dehydrogenase
MDGLDRPVAVRSAGDGTGRLFVVEQAGRILVWDPVAGLLGIPFLDITDRVDTQCNEQGLLGLAFHPDLSQKDRFYVDYVWDPDGIEDAACSAFLPDPPRDRTVVSRFTVSPDDPNQALPVSEAVVIQIEQLFGNHNGGDLHFGPDGYLYIAMGDGGQGGDPLEQAQDLSSLLGKILRIDVDGESAAGSYEYCGEIQSYSIPETNPFVDGLGSCDEIWAFGLRNPWRFSVDRFTGDLLIGDVGQKAREEIDFQPSSASGGANYGWDVLEGSQCHEDDPPGSCAAFLGSGGSTLPVLEYAHGSGDCAVTGGFRYRGHSIPGLQGVYVFADYCSGRIWFAERNPSGEWSATLWSDTDLLISSFGEGEDGDLYLVDLGGAVYRFESPSSIFGSGFESGNFSGWSQP